MCTRIKNCFFCLCNNNTLTNKFHFDETNDIIEQITFVLPEITILESDVPVHICSSCHERLNSFYNFKKMCLGNNSHFRRYLLQTSNVNSNQTHSELPKKVYIDEQVIKDELCMKLEEETEDPLATKDQDSCEISNVIFIKDEHIDRENRDENWLMNNQLVIDSEQNVAQSVQTNNDSQSFCKPNATKKSNLLTSLLYSKYTEINKDDKERKCIICNQQFARYCCLRVHMKMHLGIKNVVNNKKITPKKKLEQPIKRLKKINCPVCNKVFTLTRKLNKHMKCHEIEDNDRCYNLRSKEKI